MDLELYSSRPYVRCRCGSNLRADKQTLTKHLDTMHKDAKSTPAIETLLRPRIAPSERSIIATYLGGMGMSLNLMGQLRSISAYLQRHEWKSRSTMARDFDAGAASFMAALKDRVRGQRVHMVLDSSRSAFGRGTNVTCVLLVGPELPRPLLARVSTTTDNMNAPAYTALIQDVVREWGVVVQYVASDNTAVMPLAIKNAGMIHSPCVSHICNLACRDITLQMNVEELITLLGSLLTNPQIARQAVAEGISPSLFKCPAHRFATYFKGLAFLAKPDNWCHVRDFVARCGGATARKGPMYTLHGTFRDPGYQIDVMSAARLMTGLPDVIAESEGAIPSSTLADHMREYWDIVRTMHTRAPNMVFKQAQEAGVTMDDRQLQVHSDKLMAAAERVHDRYLRHFVRKDGTSNPIVVMAAMWDIRSPLSMPHPHAEHFARSLAIAWPDCPSEGEDEYVKFWLRRETLRIADGETLFEYYRRLRTDYPRVAHAALYALTLPVSNTMAERAFSTMSNVTVDNRTLASAKYLQRYLTVACNREWYWAYMTSVLSAVPFDLESVPPVGARPAARRDATLGAGPAGGAGTTMQAEGASDDDAEGSSDDSDGDGAHHVLVRLDADRAEEVHHSGTDDVASTASNDITDTDAGEAAAVATLDIGAGGESSRERRDSDSTDEGFAPRRKAKRSRR